MGFFILKCLFVVLTTITITSYIKKLEIISNRERIFRRQLTRLVSIVVSLLLTGILFLGVTVGDYIQLASSLGVLPPLITWINKSVFRKYFPDIADMLYGKPKSY